MPDPSSIFSKAKGGVKPPDADNDASEDYAAKEDLPPDFEDYAVTFMPDLEGDPERLQAFWKAVKACVRADGMKG